MNYHSNEICLCRAFSHLYINLNTLTHQTIFLFHNLIAYRFSNFLNKLSHPNEYMFHCLMRDHLSIRLHKHRHPRELIYQIYLPYHYPNILSIQIHQSKFEFLFLYANHLDPIAQCIQPYYLIVLDPSLLSLEDSQIFLFLSNQKDRLYFMFYYIISLNIILGFYSIICIFLLIFFFITLSSLLLFNLVSSYIKTP